MIPKAEIAVCASIWSQDQDPLGIDSWRGTDAGANPAERLAKRPRLDSGRIVEKHAHLSTRWGRCFTFETKTCLVGNRRNDRQTPTDRTNASPQP